MSDVIALMLGLLGVVALLGAGAASWSQRPATIRLTRVPRRLVHRGEVSPRIVIGRVRGRTVATEPHHSLLVIGPTQSGKTSRLVIPAIEAWPGPVLVSSVKGDVFAATRHERARRGPLTIVDPTKMTGERTASWLPYRNLSTFAEARALARDLCAVAQSATLSGDGEFWMQATARYLAPLLLAAARSGAPLEALLRWIDDDGVAEALAILHRAGDDGAAHVLLQVLSRDARQLHSILTTAEVVLEALVDGAGTGDHVDIDALLSSEGTMYLLASLSGQQRSRALLGALRNEVVARASALAAREGGVLDRPLLIVHDEAAHSSGLEQLSALAATGVGQGITVLTVFQDMGQIAHAHGALASSLVLNHRARVLLAGTIDQASVDLFVALSGERRGEERSESTSRQGKSVSRQTVTRPRLERHLVSSLRRGTAVVLYDALAPFTVQLSTAPAKRRAARVAHAQRRARRRGAVPQRGVER